ncbi:MAG: putative nucleic acid-binding protein [Candidatus Latescibacterota bacterium]|jgi:predicted nucleic acid-binding protein
MAKQKIYLDTTVPSAYYDLRTPERQAQTIQFWKETLPKFDAFVSGLVLREIADTPDQGRRGQIEMLVNEVSILDLDSEAAELAQEYIDREIFPEKYRSDAIHVAIAVINGIGYLCSWNFTHLVKVNTRREVNLVNAIKGYGQIEIIAPPEL